MERPARQALTPRISAYVQVVLLGGMVASAQRLSVQHRIGRMGRSVSSLSRPISPRAKIVAVGELVTKRSSAMVHGPFKEQQKRATVLRMDPLSKRLSEVATTGDAQVGQQRVAIEHQQKQLMHQQTTIDAKQSDTNSSCPRKPEETWLISEVGNKPETFTGEAHEWMTQSTPSKSW